MKKKRLKMNQKFLNFDRKNIQKFCVKKKFESRMKISFEFYFFIHFCLFSFRFHSSTKQQAEKKSFTEKKSFSPPIFLEGKYEKIETLLLTQKKKKKYERK